MGPAPHFELILSSFKRFLQTLNQIIFLIYLNKFSFIRFESSFCNYSHNPWFVCLFGGDDGNRTHRTLIANRHRQSLGTCTPINLVAGEGLEPPSSAYETELETTSSLTCDIFLFVITSATSWKPPLTRCLKESDSGLILLSYDNEMAAPTGFEPVPRTVTGWYCSHSTMEPYFSNQYVKEHYKSITKNRYFKIIDIKKPIFFGDGFQSVYFTSYHTISVRVNVSASVPAKSMIFKFFIFCVVCFFI